MQEKTVLEGQYEIESALEALPRFSAQLPDLLKPLLRLAPPDGLHPQVSLRHREGNRQVERNASLHSWSPESDIISISYDAVPIAAQPEVAQAEPSFMPRDSG